MKSMADYQRQHLGSGAKVEDEAGTGPAAPGGGFGDSPIKMTVLQRDSGCLASPPLPAWPAACYPEPS